MIANLSHCLLARDQTRCDVHTKSRTYIKPPAHQHMTDSHIQYARAHSLCTHISTAHTFMWILLPGTGQNTLLNTSCPWADNSVWFVWTLETEMAWERNVLKSCGSLGVISSRWHGYCNSVVREEFKDFYKNKKRSGSCKKQKKKNPPKKSKRSPVVFVVFAGRRCPQSFTKCITTICKDEVILSPSNTWGYLLRERMVISWCHTGCDLKRLKWHNCYHLRDAQTFLRLVAVGTTIIITAIIITKTHRNKRFRKHVRVDFILLWNVTEFPTTSVLPKLMFRHDCQRISMQSVSPLAASRDLVWVTVT